MKARHTPAFASLALLLLLCARAEAEVERVELDSVRVVADGMEFGAAGPYEALRGRIYFTISPSNPANAAIVDLALAPRNAAGEVEAWGDLFVLRPAERERASGLALVEVSNRGGMFTLGAFQNARASGDPIAPEHFGDGLLMKRGMTLIWVGWQFDVPEGRSLRLNVPVIREPELSGLLRSDWVVERPTRTLAVSHREHRAYPVSDPAHADNRLTVRDGREGARRVVPREQWRFAREENGQLVPDREHISMPAGFEPGKIYELVYRASEPAVVGLGLAAIRDTIAYAKYDERCEFPVERGLAVGISQTGRFLRHFLYQGFNTDEQGRQAFDGMLIHAAGAGRGSFNHRFAQPSRDGHRYSAFFYPTDLFPFAGRALRDPLTGVRAGLMPERNRPRVFYTNTGYEYWGRAASLVHTSLDGSADVEPLPNERIYHLASAQHFQIGFPPNPSSRRGEQDVWRGSPVQMMRSERALLIALCDWVAKDVAPPPSSYPRIDAGSLVPPSEVDAPRVPGLEWPEVLQLAYRADYGERWSEGIVDRQPPLLGPAFPSLVSRVDEFGNELGRARSVETLVPLATYTPWNTRWGMAGEQHELYDFYGSFAPLALDDESRAEGDSRPSIAALYPDRDAYLARVERAAEQLVDERMLLEQDRAAVFSGAERLWDWIHSRR